jgi:hypothetical protein
MPHAALQHRKNTVRSCPKGVQAPARLNRTPAVAAHPVVQAKLLIGARNDKYEQEADRVAGIVVRMPDPAVSPVLAHRLPSIQRLCSTCQEEMQRQPIEEEEELFQPQRGSSKTPAVAPGIHQRISQLRLQGGDPLPGTTRSFVEPRFKRDFSHIRIHTGPEAADLSRSVQARAFTVGNDVFFNRGAFQPATREGVRLLAHELTHTIQQGGGKDIDRSRAMHLQRALATGDAPATGPCPRDGTVRFIVHGAPVEKLTDQPTLEIVTVGGNPWLKMAAKKFEANKTVVTIKGEQGDLGDWMVGFSQTIQKNSSLHACYAPAMDPARDPRTTSGKKKTGMAVQDIGELAGGPVLDGDKFTTPNPPFYNAPSLPGFPDPKRGPTVSMNDRPQNSAPIFFNDDPSTGACLTKLIRLFKATAFVIASRGDEESCFLWHIDWGFMQFANPDSIALDASGNAHLGNFSVNFAEFPIEEGPGDGGHPSKLTPPLANTIGKKSKFKKIAAPCPLVGDGCVPL